MVEDDLLAAIAADVDSDEPRLVYADWLLTNEDPRGEQIVLQHRFDTAPNTMPAEAKARLHALVSAQTTALRIDSIQAEVIARVRLGFVDRMKLTRRAIAVIRERPEWLEALALRFVRELDLAVADPRAWEVVAAWRHRAHVRRLEHGSTDKAIDPRNVRAIVASFPRLASLKLRAPGHVHLDPLAPLPLDAFELENLELEARTMANLCAMPWRLRTLGLQTNPNTSPELLAPILVGTTFPEVRDLELVGWSAGAVVAALVASGRIATLATLRMEFTFGPVAELEKYRAALAPVRLTLPRRAGRVPHVQFGVVLARLGKYAEAIAVFAGTSLTHVDPVETIRWHAIAVRETDGDGRALLLRIFQERGHVSAIHAELLAATDELLAATRDPEVVLQRARALVGLGRGDEVLATLAEVSGASAHLLRGLACELVGDASRARVELAIAEAGGPIHRALVMLQHDELAAPDPTASPDALEIAVVAAVCVGDRVLVRERLLALDAQRSHARPWNLDLVIACEHRARSLEPQARAFLRKVHFHVRGPSNGTITHLVRFDPWLSPR